MTDVIAPRGMGLTPRMKEALDEIVAHVGRHGAMPSRRMLADALQCFPNNANRLMQCLVERGEVSARTAGGPLTGFGCDGISVAVPPHIVALLAEYCAANAEKITDVVADAIVLHLDQAKGAIE